MTRVALDLSCLELTPETGVERAARRLAEHLHEEMDEELLVFVREGQPAPAVKPPLRVVATPTRLPRFAWRELRLPQALEERGVEVLHAPVAALPLRSNAKLIATIHDVPPIGSTGAMGRFSRHRLRLMLALRRAARLIVPSVATERALLEIDPEAAPRIRVIPQGVDDDFTPLGLPLHRKRFGLSDGPFLLSVGTVRPRKAPGLLIEAFKQLTADGSHPDLQLVFAGAPQMDTDILRALVRGTPAEDRLHFLGYVPREDLPDLYRAAEVLVQPSELEGFGMTALEGMACGRPILTSSDPALRALVGEAGAEFETGNLRALVRALEDLLSDSDRTAAMQRAAVQVAGHYSWARTAAAHAAVYRELLG